MLTLSSRQRRKIEDYQQRSFEDYCARCGYEVDEHAALLLDLVRKKLDALFSEIALEDHPDSLKQMREASSVWEVKRIGWEIRRTQHVSVIMENAVHLPIDYDYLIALSDRVGLPQPDPQRPESIRDIVDAVPVICSWDWEFNAFVTPGPLVGDGPCICIQEALLSVCEIFSAHIAPRVFEGGSKKGRLVSPKRVEELASQPALMLDIRDCLRLAMGKSNYSKQRAPAVENTITGTASAITEGAIAAVWYHEFGHLLRGHFGQHASHRVELEADECAFKLLAAQDPPKLAVWSCLGGLLVLLVIELIAKARNQPEGTSHPSGRRRIETALRILADERHEIVAPVQAYLNAIANLCRPTLREYWGAELFEKTEGPDG